MPERRVVPTISVGNVPFEVTTRKRAVDDLVRDAGAGTAVGIRFSNAYCVALASRDRSYLALLRAGGRNYPDGWPVARIMKSINHTGDPCQQVRGVDFMRESLTATQDSRLKHYFIASTDNLVESLLKGLLTAYPSLSIAGAYAPPFDPSPEVLSRYCLSQPEIFNADIVWVGLGSPKQDFVLEVLAQNLSKPCLGVGAALEFFVGSISEAPVWMQRLGLEWLHRLASDPRRLWRRYTFGTFWFLRAVAPEMFQSVLARRNNE